MKKILILLSLAFLVQAGYCQTQTRVFTQEDLDAVKAVKRESRKNLVIREWNTDARTKTRWLDHQTTYDSSGRKIEEIEYSQYGQNWRETYEYGDNDKIVKDVQYNEKDRPVIIRKYEYDSENKKIKQYNYSPSGKLMTVKIFEYEFSE